jgi:hypothetical protein
MTTVKQKKARASNVRKAHPAQIKHGLHRLRRLTPNRWPPALRRIRRETILKLEAMDHLRETDEMLVQAIADVVVFVKVGTNFAATQSLLKADFNDVLALSREVRAWHNTLLRYLQAAGLTPTASRQIATEALSITDLLSQVDPAEEVKDDAARN